MPIALDERSLAPFERVSLYNSPYPAHDEGCAVDCYPGTGRGTEAPAPSPVAGVVRETRTVSAPPKPYAPEHDHLVLVDVEGPGDLAGTVARILHVDPSVEAGDRVAVGDSLGTLVRAGFFAPWVADHVHLGLRRPDQDLVRASGSLPLALDVDLVGLSWDGTGTVTECGETYAILDSPTLDAATRSPRGDAPTRSPDRDARTATSDGGGGGVESGGRDRWVGVAADGGGVLDGGLPHYDGGGLLARPEERPRNGPVRVAGRRVGIAHGRDVEWDDVTVRASGIRDDGNESRDDGCGIPTTGLSFSIARAGTLRPTLVWRDPRPDRLPVGSPVRVSIESPGPTGK